ncbi:MAG TPA: ACT domain-containing protein, partial [Gammaproteobacteria bacterium]|nr:ACT domain-containing protein [Gammaproteobacteria bacterium]
RCRGARINGRIAPLTTSLNTGDRVEILTARDGTPSRDWLIPQAGYLTTPRARAKLRTWFRQQDYDQNVAQGRSLVERELNRLSVDGLPYEKLSEAFSGYRGLENATPLEKFLALVGSGDITTNQLAGAIERLTGLAKQPTVRRRTPRKRTNTAGLQVQGVDNLLTQLARCCNPLPPEEVIGFITRGRGVSVHHADCGNIRHADKTRLIEVEWETDNSQYHNVHVTISAYDRHGILRDISTALTTENVNIAAMNSQVNRRENLATIELVLEIHDLAHLSRALYRISRLNGIISAQRTR